MADTAARLLQILSLLQMPRDWAGSELAQRLEVSGRTIRRDVDRLRALGYPIEASRGAVGGYRLVGGAAMPPLLLDDDEAVAIAVGLRAVVGQAVAGSEEASVRALVKLQQVLPPRLRSRVSALSAATASLAWARPVVDAETLMLLARAIGSHERLRFAYAAADAARSQRMVEPWGVVVAGRRWYLVAWDVDRGDWRTFRVDRVHEPRAIPGRVMPRELPAPDAAAYLANTLDSLAPTYPALATVRMPATQVRARLPEGAGVVESLDPRTSRVRLHDDTLEWLGFRLALLGAEFEVHQPPELAAHLAALAARLARAVAK
jgi:predicted DNA-binding transcriptional regulator YafY